MEKRSKSNQSVEKTFQIIETMAEARRPLRLQDISQKTHLPASTVLRMVNTLVDMGYAFQEQETLRYGLTLQFARIGSLAGSGIGLRDYAHPVMESLSAACGEACCLAIEQNEEVVYIDLVDGPDNMLRIMQHIGKRAPMHCTGIGKLLLLNRTQEMLENYIQKHGLQQFTEHTLTTAAALQQELEQVRHQGWAMDNEECEIGARCVAAGIYDYTGSIVGGISISGPTTRLTLERLPEIAVNVQQAGLQISKRLGWLPDPSEADLSKA